MEAKPGNYFNFLPFPRGSSTNGSFLWPNCKDFGTLVEIVAHFLHTSPSGQCFFSSCHGRHHSTRTMLLVEGGSSLAASAYAGHWCWWTTSVQEQWTSFLPNWLGLETDWGKTWQWATDSHYQQEMNDIVRHFAPNAKLARVQTAWDLWAPVTYQGFKERLSKAKDRLGRIQRARWALSVKIHLNCGGFYPAALCIRPFRFRTIPPGFIANRYRKCNCWRYMSIYQSGAFLILPRLPLSWPSSVILQANKSCFPTFSQRATKIGR